MLEKKLATLGLSEKESRVYLAALELGTSTVQELARKSGVNRATTYIQVDLLIKRGLMSKVEKASKTLFLVEKPQRIIDILGKKKAEIESLESAFTQLMPELEAIYNVKTDKPRVRFYESAVGLENFRREMIKANPAVIYSIFPQAPSAESQEAMPLFMTKIKSMKTIYAGKENIKFSKKVLSISNLMIKFFKLDDFDIEITMYNNKVFINKPITNESMGVLIEDKSVYKSFVAMFQMFWAMGADVLAE